MNKDVNVNKAQRLAEIMFQEDKERVERGEKPFYTTEEDFFAEHPEMKNKDCTNK